MRAVASISNGNEEELPFEAEPKKKPCKKREPKFIQPTVGNFKRTKNGQKLVKQEVLRLLRLQAKKMPEKALMDYMEKEVQYKYDSREGKTTVEKLLLKAFDFISNHFRETRAKLQYGVKVQTWLSNIEKDLFQYKTKSLHELVSMISLYEPASLKGYKDDGEDGEDHDSAEGESSEEESDWSN